MERKTFSQVKIYVRDSYNRAGRMAEVKDYAGAVETLAPVVMQNPEVPQLFERLRTCEIERAKTQNIMIKLWAIFKSLFSAPLIFIIALIDPIRAMRMCEKHLSHYVDSPLILSVLAFASDRADAPWGVVSAYNVTRLLHGGSTVMLKKLAMAMQNNNQAGEALKIHQQILNNNPNNLALKEELRSAMALASLERGRWDEKGSTQEKAKQAAKGKKGSGDDDVVLHQLLEGTIHDAEQAQLVIDKFTQMLEKNDSLDMRRKLADAYMVAEKYAEAHEQYVRVEKMLGVLDPVLDKQIEQAHLADLDKQIAALQTGNGDPAAVQALEDERQKFHQEHIFLRAERFPNDPQLQYDLGEFSFEQGDLDKAKAIFTAVADFPQKRRASLVSLARCAIQTQEPDVAIGHLQEALKDMYRMDKYKREALYYLGIAYELGGQREQALDCYVKIRTSMANYRDISERIAALSETGAEAAAQ